MDKLINIEIAYALPKKQFLLAYSVPEKTSLLKAIELSAILKYFPEISLSKNSIGVFGKRIQQVDEYKLLEGDRIEIYRPLQIDPKEARRKRAEKLANKKA